MQRATNQAFELAEKEIDSDILKLFLTEAPIGDEYGVLTQEQWNRGNAWVIEIEASGVVVW